MALLVRVVDTYQRVKEAYRAADVGHSSMAMVPWLVQYVHVHQVRMNAWVLSICTCGIITGSCAVVGVPDQYALCMAGIIHLVLAVYGVGTLGAHEASWLSGTFYM